MIIRDNLLVKRSDKKVFLLNLLTFRRKLLSEDTYRLFEQVKDKDPEEYTEQERILVQSLEEDGQFLSSEQVEMVESVALDEQEKMRGTNGPLQVNLILTYGCNARCIYCFQRQIEGLPPEDVQTLTPAHVDQIEAFYQQYAEELGVTGEYEIFITGGEPLLLENRSILNYIFNKWDRAKYNLTTNAVNLEKMIDDLPVDRISYMKISLDGVAEIHNRRRPVIGVVDPFTATIRGVEKALEHGIQISFKITADRETIHHLPELFEFLDEKGWLKEKRVGLSVTGVFTRDDGTRLDPAYNNMQEMMEGQLAIKQIDPRVAMIKNNVFYGLGWLIRAMTRPMNHRIPTRTYGCSILHQPSYTFDPSGGIYLCGDLVATEAGKVGTYYPEVNFDLEKIRQLKERHVFNMPKCRKCAFRFVCGGGCPGTALRSEGNLMAPSCNYFKEDYVLEHLGELFF